MKTEEEILNEIWQNFIDVKSKRIGVQCKSILGSTDKNKRFFMEGNLGKLKDILDEGKK